jgi:dTDP-glucose 4,6-dehydratase
MRAVVTGGAGFIGSALVRRLVSDGHHVLNIDKLTYAANLRSLKGVSGSDRYKFAQLDICDREAIAQAIADYAPDVVFHLAAESHVDRSIEGAGAFVTTNVVGTFSLLEAVRSYCLGLAKEEAERFRFIHVSTDEVFGSLGDEGTFSEDSPYQPSSPYSASKAASDHFAHAWHVTYGLPVIVTNCSNNYGPYQYPEKLIPVVIASALSGKPIPVYGDGRNVRDWLHVEDHVRALLLIAERGQLGERYNVGGGGERSNLDAVRAITAALDAELGGGPRADLIAFVADRPGHDWRYAIDSTKLRNELGWQPEIGFEDGIRETVRWYLANRDWWAGA